MIQIVNLEKEVDNSASIELHTCPLKNWCDQCAFCEFEYDNLKKKSQNQGFEKLDIVFNPILLTINSRLNELEGKFTKEFKQNVQLATEILDSKFASLKAKLEEIKEKYFDQVDSIKIQILKKINEDYDDIRREQIENSEDLEYIKPCLEQNLKLIQEYIDFEIKFSNLSEDTEWDLLCKFEKHLENFEQDIIFKNIQKTDVLDVQILDSDVFLCSYKDREEIDIFNLNDEDHIRSIKYHLNGTKVFPMYSARLVMVSSEDKTDVTIWDLRTNESKTHTLKDDRNEPKNTYFVYFVLGESYIVGRRENYSRTYYETFDCCIWVLDDFEINFFKEFEIESQNFELWPIDSRSFASYSQGSINIWNASGIPVREIKIDCTYIHDMRSIGNYLIYQNENLTTKILSLETDKVIESFENSKLIGTTPYEIFMKIKDTENIKVYAIDDYLTYLGLANFGYTSKVDEICFINELSWFVFRDEKKQCLDIKKITGLYKGIKKLEDSVYHTCKSHVKRRCACCEMNYSIDNIDKSNNADLKSELEKSFNFLEDSKNQTFEIIRSKVEDLKNDVKEKIKTISEKLDNYKEKIYSKLNQNVKSCLQKLENRNEVDGGLIKRIESMLCRIQLFYEIKTHVLVEDEMIKLSLINEDISDDAHECNNEGLENNKVSLESILTNKEIFKIQQQWKYLDKHFNLSKCRSFSTKNIDYFNYFILKDKIALVETHRGNNILLYDARDSNDFSNYQNNDSEIEIENIHFVDDEIAVVTTCNRDWSAENISWLSIWYWKSSSFKKLEPLNSKFIEQALFLHNSILVITTCSFNIEDKPLITAWQKDDLVFKKLNTLETETVEKLVKLSGNVFGSFTRTELKIFNTSLDILCAYKNAQINLESINKMKYLINELVIIEGEAFQSSETLLVILNFKDNKITSFINLCDNVDDFFITFDKKFLVLLHDHKLKFHDFINLNQYNYFNIGFKIEQFCNKSEVYCKENYYICCYYQDQRRYLTTFDFNNS